MELRVSQVKPSDCFMHLLKNSFTFHFWHVFHPWCCETCRIIQRQFWMKECVILGGGQNILWRLPHIFRKSRPPTPRIYAAVSLCACFMFVPHLFCNLCTANFNHNSRAQHHICWKWGAAMSSDNGFPNISHEVDFNPCKRQNLILLLFWFSFSTAIGSDQELGLFLNPDFLKLFFYSLRLSLNTDPTCRQRLWSYERIALYKLLCLPRNLKEEPAGIADPRFLTGWTTFRSSNQQYQSILPLYVHLLAVWRLQNVKPWSVSLPSQNSELLSKFHEIAVWMEFICLTVCELTFSDH